MPISPTSFVPNLVEQIFQKYEIQFAEERKSSDSPSSTTVISTISARHKQFFIELDSIFGEVLQRAIRLLDEQTITVYCTESRIRDIAEISGGRNSATVIKLLPGINFCPCEYFARSVLKLALPSTTSTTSTAGASAAAKSVDRYTCEHVLALRLAQLLHVSALRVEVLPKHKFNYLLSQMRSS